MGALEQIRSYWDARARAALTDNERIDSTERSQRARFADVVRALGNAGSVLDVGCGVGDLFGYLREHRPGVQYMGVDLSPEMIKRAKDKHPWGCFGVASILDWPDTPRADAVVAVGLHSLPLDGVRDQLRAVLGKQYALARMVAHANLLSRHYPHTAAVQSWWPDDVLAVAGKLTPWVSLQHDYLPHDFSVTLRREQRP